MDFRNDGWLTLVEEEVVDPDRVIVDAHHHLWPPGGPPFYGLDDFLRDTGSGHRVEQTIFVECGAAYRKEGPRHLRPVGETEFTAAAAAASAERPGATIAAIVARADLRLGGELEEALALHAEAGRGLFRGIRHSLARATRPEGLRFPFRMPEGLSEDSNFRAGVATLGKKDLVYDCWLYHDQIGELAAVARSAPGTIVVFDHFGTPVGVGPYAAERETIFERWKRDVADLSRCENVVAKLGGLAMPDNGFGWDTRDTPATSDEIVEAHRPYYIHTIEHFGPERCMFESNFPVDRQSFSYRVLFNAMKKMVADFSEAEKEAMFSDTARRVYRV